MVKESDKEAAYTSMLSSFYSISYEDLEKFKSEFRKKQILSGSYREYPMEKTCEVNYDFLIDHMKNSQVGSMDENDEVLRKKLDRKLRDETGPSID